jgi:hypothetical protein
MRPDIVVYGTDHKLKLLVEVKSKIGASLKWVVEMRRNLLAHAIIHPSPYFLLALSDSFHLWRNAEIADEQSPPDYSVPASQVLAAYLKDSSISLDNISEYGLEMLVSSWLTQIVISDLTIEATPPEQLWLFESGLYQAIHGGSIITQAAA